MKKYISLLIVFTITIFIGMGMASAVTLQLDKYDCTDAEEVANSDKAVTTCTVYGKATSSGTLSGTQTFELTYYKKTALSSFEFASETTDAGQITNIKRNTDLSTGKGGTWDFTFKEQNVTEGQQVVLFIVNIFADKNTVGTKTTYNGKEVPACGGIIAYAASGDNTSNDKGGTIAPKDTGFSIPVAIIGFGAIAGLSIYASTSRKTKMHRI